MAKKLIAALILASTLGPFGIADAVPLKSPPAWTDLSADQQKILAPLANEWNSLEKQRREKWLGIAKRYPSMTPEEQLRVQNRMRYWVSLTPEQRRAARERYKDLQNISPEKREALKQRWDEYEHLPPEEKKRLATPVASTPADKRLRPLTNSSRPLGSPAPTSSGTRTGTAGQLGPVEAPLGAQKLSGSAATPASELPASEPVAK